MNSNQRHAAVWLLLAALMTAALLAVCSRAPSMGSLSAQRVVRLNSQWEQTESGAYRYSIPEDSGPGPMIFLMKTYLRGFTLLLDGQAIYSHASSLNDRSYHIVALPQDAPGRTLVLQRTDAPGTAAGNNRLGSAYLGSWNEIYISLLQDNLYALIFLIFALLAAGVLLAVAFHLRKQVEGPLHGGLLYLGLFILDTGIWVVTDSDLLLFVTGRVEAISLVSFASFLIMPVFLLRFIQFTLHESRKLELLCRLFALITAAYLLNALFSLIPAYFLLLPAHLLCVCIIVVILAGGVKRLRKKRDKPVESVMLGFLLLSLFVAAALVRFYSDPLANYAYFYCVGIILFAVSLVNAAFLILYEQVKENANTAAYKRLAYMDAMTGMENRAAYMEAQQAAESAAGLSCVVFDINDLKWINDRYGHQEGDQAIITAAGFIRDTFGALGTCYRIGGDEFVVFLKDRPAEQIAAGLDKIKALITAEKRASGSHFDIAAGYAVRREGETVAQMIRRADAGMYAEKQRMKDGKGPADPTARANYGKA